MSEIITKGYLIARNDYQMFDEIITFINEFGNKFVCLAQGSKKIESHKKFSKNNLRPGKKYYVYYTEDEFRKLLASRENVE